MYSANFFFFFKLSHKLGANLCVGLLYNGFFLNSHALPSLYVLHTCPLVRRSMIMCVLGLTGTKRVIHS